VLGLLVLLTIGFVVWKLWSPAMAWAPAFAALLDRPVRKTGLLPFLVGLETAGGDFQGRSVLLALHHKRGRHSLGYLVVAMQPRVAGNAAPGLGPMRTPQARTALDQLEEQEGLSVSFDDGWLKARWQPVGFTIFPGRFDAQRWHRVLQEMAVIAEAMEAGPA
jgi:hypothetical protein